MTRRTLAIITKELEIAKFFSSEDKMRDRRNHCAPVLEYFEDEKLPEYGVLVTPLYREFDRPEFDSIDEVLEFIGQTLEVCLTNLRRSWV